MTTPEHPARAIAHRGRQLRGQLAVSRLRLADLAAAYDARDAAHEEFVELARLMDELDAVLDGL